MRIDRWFSGVFMAVAVFASIARAQWSAELARDSTPVIRYDGARVFKFNYVAWGPSWKYATFKAALGHHDPDGYAFSGDVATLGITFNGKVNFENDSLVYEWTMKTTKASTGNIGGAINMDLRLDKSIFGVDDIGKTEIAPDGNGLSWTPIPGQTLSVTFTQLARPCAFEKGKLDQVRGWIIPADLEPGEKTFRMTIKLPAGATFKGVPASRYENPSDDTWLSNTLNWSESPVDLSYLNDKPAGSKGFVKAQGDQLVFADGTPARFWGCNLQAFALFDATDDAIQQQAKRIAALGYNLVRLHHHDSADWVTPNVFAKDANDTQHLDDKALDRLDYWVKCLKDNGVYVWLDLHVGRPFRPGDNIPGYNELTLNTKTGNRQAKGFNYVNDRVTDLMKDFAKQYLTRENRYTHIRYVDEPAVMGILITNENDITDHYGNNFLPDKHKPQHAKWFAALQNPLISERGLDPKTAWQTWMPGQSKVVLNDVQYNWGRRFVDYLHSIGVKVPIATTNTWGSDPLFSLPALTAGDVIDVHTYGESESFNSNPRHDDLSTFWIAAAQVVGKPVTITEWNTPYPMRDRFTQPLYVAAQAAFQGWDAPMIFGYQQAPMVPQSKLSEWTTANDPALTSLMPAAALIYRRGDVEPAKKTVVLSLTPEQMLYKAVSPQTSAAIRTEAEQHKLEIAMPKTPLLPWLQPTPTPAGAEVITDPAYDALPKGATSVESDTGQLKRDFNDGIFTIDTPKTQAAMGWIGGKDISLGDVTFSIKTAKATIVLSSLDDQPLSTSKKMLLTVAAQAAMPHKKSLGILSEPVIGSLKLKNDPISAVALTPGGKTSLPLPIDHGLILLQGKLKTQWFILSR
ncbi:MAG: cellulase family glycosylhydrolase [Tepidisphaeraceae bacterium]